MRASLLWSVGHQGRYSAESLRLHLTHLIKLSTPIPQVWIEGHYHSKQESAAIIRSFGGSVHPPALTTLFDSVKRTMSRGAVLQSLRDYAETLVASSALRAEIILLIDSVRTEVRFSLGRPPHRNHLTAFQRAFPVSYFSPSPSLSLSLSGIPSRSQGQASSSRGSPHRGSTAAAVMRLSERHAMSVES